MLSGVGNLIFMSGHGDKDVIKCLWNGILTVLKGRNKKAMKEEVTHKRSHQERHIGVPRSSRDIVYSPIFDCEVKVPLIP